LGKPDAALIRMKYKSNMTNVAIAKKLKMSEAGVRKRMVKAHENVKKIIMKMIDDNEQ
jgi:DNA-binding transcriptional regulator LsrR (DeoR family)